MSNTFPRTRGSRKGYHVDQVEDFLEDARRAYTAEPGVPAVLRSADIRRTAFSMQRGGYSPQHVDAALERLEDAFAARERERALTASGEQDWYAGARSAAQELLDRLARPAGRKFKRVSWLTAGYHPDDVDAFAERLTGYFQHGKPMSVEQVRLVTFRGCRGGYHEQQVDVLLDAVIEVMLAVR